jgi:TP901-1 family phage major tail protein
MPALAGGLLLIRLDATGAGSYQNLAGLRAKSIKINAEAVDITNSDSTNKFRELLAGAGIKSMEITGSGVFLDDTYQNTLIDYMRNNTIRNWQFSHTSIGTFQGLFMVSALEINGDFNSEVTFTATLMSAGEVTFTQA